MKNFCRGLKEHIMKVTNFKRLKMLPLTEEKNICRDKFNNNERNYWKICNHDYYTEKFMGADIKTRTEFQQFYTTDQTTIIV